MCWRWSDLDFGANLRDGHGADWPIRYKDLAPWYAYVERFVGVSGERLGLAHLPDGEFLPPWELNCAEQIVKQGIEHAFRGRHMTITRVANLTQAHNGRGACQARNQCARGCSFGGYFSSLFDRQPPGLPGGGQRDGGGPEVARRATAAPPAYPPGAGATRADASRSPQPSGPARTAL